MKKYEILKPIMLSFLTPRDQIDATILPEDGLFLECDGSTIWVMNSEQRQEAITTANAIDIWLEQGKIVEV